MKIHSQILIIGGGLAGLSLALSLTDKGFSVTIIDNKRMGSGASGVPIALINPAAAKQANLAWNAERCMSSIAKFIGRVSDSTGHTFYKKSGVLRPAVDTKTLQAFKSSLKRHPFPKGWAKWLTGEQVSKLNPDCNHAGGALWVEEAYTVDLPRYILAMIVLLEKKGVFLFEHIEHYTLIQEHSQKWHLTSHDSFDVESDHVIHCTGSSILSDPDWNWLPVHHIKGQMSQYQAHKPIPWEYSIAAKGYVAHLDNRSWAIGSTFEHNFEHHIPDIQGQHYLEQKVDAILPSLRSESTIINRWAGLRLGTPDRLPLIGRHPYLSGRWIFSGLGSKGLYYSAYLAEELSKYIKDNTYCLPDEVDIKRYYKHFSN